MKLRTIQRLESSEGGFALVAVVFVLVLLGVLAVTSFITTGDERRASHGMRESARAFYAAEAGVNLVLAEWDSLQYDTLFTGPGSSVDLGWRTLSENGASHQAVIRRVDNGGSATYALSVEGRGAGAHRVINLLFIMGTGLEIDGAAIRGGYGATGRIEDLNALTGIDAHPPGWAECTGALVDVPGIVWQNGSLDIDDPQGNPPYVVDGTINSTNLWEFGGLTYDDLVAMADITLGPYTGSPGPSTSGGACNTSDPNNWGAPESPGHVCRDYFPIIHIAGIGDMSGGNGQGILLIDGNSDWDGGLFTFYGIVMVKGSIDEWDDGDGVHGAVITAGIDRIRDGSFAHYSSCAVDRVLQSLSLQGGLERLSWSEDL